MPPQTIDDVLIELDQIILRARNDATSAAGSAFSQLFTATLRSK